MNFKLKETILRRYGSQADFAIAMREHEAVVSRAVRGRYDPPPDKKEKWARALKSDEKELFSNE